MSGLSQLLIACAQVFLVAVAAFAVTCLLMSLLKYDLRVRAARYAPDSSSAPPEELLRVEIADRQKRPGPGIVLFLLSPGSADSVAPAGVDHARARLAASLRTSDLVLQLDDLTLAALLICRPQAVDVVAGRLREALGRAESGAWRLAAVLAGQPVQRPADLIAEARKRLALARQQSRDILPEPPSKEVRPPLFGPDNFLPELQRYVAYYRKSGASVSLLSIAVDNLDRYGRHYGAHALENVGAAVSSALQQNIRIGDFVAHVRQGSFLACLPARMGEAESVGRRLVRAVRALSIPFERGTLRVTVSIGVATIPEHAPRLKAALDCSRRALSQAQSRGPGRVMVFSAPQAGRGAEGIAPQKARQVEY